MEDDIEEREFTTTAITNGGHQYSDQFVQPKDDADLKIIVANKNGESLFLGEEDSSPSIADFATTEATSREQEIISTEKASKNM